MPNNDEHLVGRAGLVLGNIAGFGLVMASIVGGHVLAYVMLGFVMLAGYVVFVVRGR